MTGRASVFADSETIALVNKHFIAVTGDDWYQRRRTDAEGQFWKKVSDQGPRRTSHTKQGVYCFTTDGELLVYRNHLDANVMREDFKKAVRKWEQLPAERRKPGAVKIEDAGKLDARYHRVPPKDGLVLRTYTRILDRKDGSFCKANCDHPGHDFAARDHIWLTADEVRKLVPADPKKGDTVALPPAVAVRLARFHFVDNTRGEPPHWKKEEIRSLKMPLQVEEVSEARIRLRLDGNALLATDADAKKADRGFDVRLLGWIEYDRTRKAIVRFDAVALGDSWGEGSLTRGARPGRTPLGVAIELAKGDEEADKVPPQGARWLEGYYRADR